MTHRDMSVRQAMTRTVELLTRLVDSYCTCCTTYYNKEYYTTMLPPPARINAAWLTVYYGQPGHINSSLRREEVLVRWLDYYRDSSTITETLRILPRLLDYYLDSWTISVPAARWTQCPHRPCRSPRRSWSALSGRKKRRNGEIVKTKHPNVNPNP